MLIAVQVKAKVVGNIVAIVPLGLGTRQEDAIEHGDDCQLINADKLLILIYSEDKRVEYECRRETRLNMFFFFLFFLDPRVAFMANSFIRIWLDMSTT